MIITIDGPSGAGKSTVGRMVAGRLGFQYVDTGALYRAVAWWVRKSGTDPDDEISLKGACGQMPLRVDWDDRGNMRVWHNNEDISDAIRNDEIGMLASTVSAHRVVRERLWGFQRALGAQGDKVFEGRDMGSQVFPDAEFRFYITASLRERAYRRYLQLKEMGVDADIDEVCDRMAQRDKQDSSRALAPLQIPEGAIIIDTSNSSPVEIVEHIVRALERRSGN